MLKIKKVFNLEQYTDSGLIVVDSYYPTSNSSEIWEAQIGLSDTVKCFALYSW